MKKSIINSFLGGASISFGCFCYLITLQKTDNVYLASTTFYLGLLLIILMKTDLFTGKVFSNSHFKLQEYIKSLAITWLGNLAGGVVASFCFYQIIKPDLTSLISNKLSLNPIQMLISGTICNILVCTAVYAFSKTNNHLISGFLIVCFVLLGIEHIVANFSYFTIGFCSGLHINLFSLLKSLFFVTIGNIIGGRIIVYMVNKN